MASTLHPFPSKTIYDQAHDLGVFFIGLAGLSSSIAIVYLFIFHRLKLKTFNDTHLFAYFLSLLAANIFQCVGTVINFEWVAQGGVILGLTCTFQGAFKQAGNLAVSVWSLIIAIHVFNVLFLRISVPKVIHIGALCFAWSFIFFIVLVGRFAMQRPELGPYYGISGAWCWISPNYPKERMFLEYFFAFISIGISFFLYIAALLRIRGNLVRDSTYGWRVRFLPKGEDWRLAIGQDIVDKNMLRVVRRMIWYPVVYSVILVPISILRIYEFNGNSVPFVLTAIAGVLFNFMGLINVIFLIYAERCLPKTRSILPQLSAKRERSRYSISKSGGVIPFTIRRSEVHDEYMNGRAQRIVVHLPTVPPNTFVAPDSWKTSAPKGKLY